MADILIRGMEMPKDHSLWLWIEQDGTVYNLKPAYGGGLQGQYIVLPPHGRLIDADALFAEMENAGWYVNADRDEVAEALLEQANTIVPAEGGNKT